jgi:hypothetical protein
MPSFMVRFQTRVGSEVKEEIGKVNVKHPQDTRIMFVSLHSLSREYKGKHSTTDMREVEEREKSPVFSLP